MSAYPLLIQGGMGVGISGWRLAQSVSKEGHLGVVSGTGLDTLFIRTLQIGDPGGFLKKALDSFPFPEIADKIYKKYFSVSLGETRPFKSGGMISAKIPADLQELIVVANYCEVFLAKLGHLGDVGINFLEKIQTATLPSIYGALLGGVDYVIMGAGIPKDIPGALDALSQHKNFSLNIAVAGAEKGDVFKTSFSPSSFANVQDIKMKRPKFLAIISSTLLGKTLVRRSNGKVNGFVIEAPTAGGHNAPPRGATQLNERGEPIYGERDQVDFENIQKLDLPFWLAGSVASPEGLRWSLEQGAQGIQIGTPFALCNESGLRIDLKESLLKQAATSNVDVFTDPKASPTGFPFKIARMPETLSEPAQYQSRSRICDAGYLRSPYKKEDGTLGYRCASEPEKNFLKKGGKEEDLTGRKCLCNALFANIGLGQKRKSGYVEEPIITIGDSVNEVYQYMPKGGLFYSAKQVIEKLTSKITKKTEDVSVDHNLS